MTRILLSSVAAAACWRARPAAWRRPRSSGGTPWAATWARWSTAASADRNPVVARHGRQSWRDGQCLAEGFNKSQTEYKVNPVYKGTYTETLTAAIAAFRAKQAPHILQVFEVGTATMMAAKGAVYPVYQLMADAKEPFDPKAYIGPVAGYYSTTDGKLLSMPFNSSTPVLYYNKELFKKAGLDPNKPPTTWPELGEMAKKARGRRRQVRVHAEWQTWTHDRELRRLAQRAVRDQGERLRRHRHRARSSTTRCASSSSRCWPTGARTRRSSTAAARASRRRCSPPANAPLHIASSARRGGIDKALGRDKFGIAMLPYSPDVAGAPQNSIIGGATLWVMEGKPKAEYKGVAKFLTFLSSPRCRRSGTRRPATCRSRWRPTS